MTPALPRISSRRTVMPDKTTIHPSSRGTAFSPIEDIIADIRDGKMVIMVDDENRENEGDLLMAAEKVRPEDINYMARYGAWPHLPDDDPRTLCPVAPAAHGGRDRSAPCDQFHDLDRGCRRHHDRDLGARPRANGAGCGCGGRQARAPVSAGPHISRHGAARGRTDTRRDTPKPVAILRVSPVSSRPPPLSRS